MAYFIQPPDLASILSGAQRMVAMDRQREADQMAREDRSRELAQRESEFKRQFEIRRALASTLSAAPEERESKINEVYALDPSAGMQVAEFHSKMDAKGQALADAETKAQQKGQYEAAAVWAPIVEEYRKSPTPATLMKGLRQLQLSKQAGVEISDDDVNTFKLAAAKGDPQDADLAAMQDTANQVVQMWGPKSRSDMPGDYGKVAQLAGVILGGWEGDSSWAMPEKGMAHNRWPEAMRAAQAELNSRASASAARNVINVDARPPGTQENTTQFKGEMQSAKDTTKSALTDVQSLLGQIEDMPDKDLFTFGGRANLWAADKASQSNLLREYGAVTGQDEASLKGKLERAQRFKGRSTLMAYKMLVALSGKATTDREREILFDALGAAESMSKERYKAALENLQDMFKQRLTEVTRTLREGTDEFLDDEDRAQWDARILDVESRRKAKEITQEEATKEMLDLRQDYKGFINQRRSELEKGGANYVAPATKKAIEELASRADAEGWSKERQQEEARKAGLIK